MENQQYRIHRQKMIQMQYLVRAVLSQPGAYAQVQAGIGLAANGRFRERLRPPLRPAPFFRQLDRVGMKLE